MNNNSIDVAKLEKLNQTLERHKAHLEKKKKALEKLTDPVDISWCEFDIKNIEDSIKNTEEKIEKQKITIEKNAAKARKRMSDEERIPDILKKYREKLVTSWDKYDLEKKAKLLEQGSDYYKNENGKTDFKKYHEYYDLINKDEKKIHSDNMRDATAMVVNLINRVEKKVGAIIDYKYLNVTNGNWREGGTAINGYVIGENGSAKIDSIIAGGYNIQKLHVRVLVK